MSKWRKHEKNILDYIKTPSGTIFSLHLFLPCLLFLLLSSSSFLASFSFFLHSSIRICVRARICRQVVFFLDLDFLLSLEKNFFVVLHISHLVIAFLFRRLFDDRFSFFEAIFLSLMVSFYSKSSSLENHRKTISSNDLFSRWIKWNLHSLLRWISHGENWFNRFSLSSTVEWEDISRKTMRLNHSSTLSIIALRSRQAILSTIKIAARK